MDSYNQREQSWVEQLFARLQVRYGNRWSRLWEGIDPEAIKADWENVLGRLYLRRPEAISFGLDHLPEMPPTSEQFLTLCLRSPGAALALPPPSGKPSPAVMGRVNAALKSANGKADRGSEAHYCASRLRTFQARHGRPLGMAQKAMLQACELQLNGGVAPDQT